LYRKVDIIKKSQRGTSRDGQGTIKRGMKKKKKTFLERRYPKPGHDVDTLLMTCEGRKKFDSRSGKISFAEANTSRHEVKEGQGSKC